MASGPDLSPSSDDARAEPIIGASDGDNGGGSGAGVPDAETGMRVGDPGHDADVARDREKLFPGSGRPKGGQSDVPADQQPAPKGL